MCNSACNNTTKDNSKVPAELEYCYIGPNLYKTCTYRWPLPQPAQSPRYGLQLFLRRHVMM